MQGKFGNSNTRPMALGLQPQTAVYGITVPVIYGMTRQPLQMIWANNLRNAGSDKAFKQKKKGPPTYAENVDFILGHNPISGVMQFWNNNGQKLILDMGAVARISIAFSISFSVTIPNPHGSGPDPDFYAILGVTLDTNLGNGTYTDYGAQGSVSLTGVSERPLWNSAYGGPDPVNPSQIAQAPFIYRWVPGQGPIIYFDYFPAMYGMLGNINIYYARKIAGVKSASKSHSTADLPITSMRMTFEPELGDGPEYSGYSSEQIIYPHYAGLGTDSLDMGASGMVPNILSETLGSYPTWPTGDADFADMVEDIIRQGRSQAGFGAATPFSKVQKGLNCSEFPGMVQKKLVNSALIGSLFNTLEYDQPNVAGNTLVAAVSNSTEVCTISDSAGNTWTPIFAGGLPYQVWYATAIAYAGNVVTFTGLTIASTHVDLQILEFEGLPTVDAVATSSGAYTAPITGNIMTANLPGQPAYIMALAILDPLSAPSWTIRVPSGWKALTQGNPSFPAAGIHGYQIAFYKLVTQPGTYDISFIHGMTNGNWRLAMMSWLDTDPPSFPKPLGDIIDAPSLQIVRNQCRANGLYGSLFMDSQRPAKDWLEELYICMNAWPVWSGFKLKSVALSEQTALGNGTLYRPPTANGPLADLKDTDFNVDSPDTPPIVVERKAQIDVPNLMQIQHLSRVNDYNEVLTTEPEPSTISLYGTRIDSPINLRMIHDVAIARMILGILVRRRNFLRNTYKFPLKANWQLLEVGDLVTLTDAELGLSKFPVRLTNIKEDDKYNLECEAEPFMFGVHVPKPVTTTAPSPYIPQVGVEPAAVNTPIFIEAVPRLDTATGLWIIVSDSDPVYGGCSVYLSTDGGVSYIPVGVINGSAVTGVTVGTWAAAADPDTTNDLAVDLTESLGTLLSYQVSDEDNFVFPCWVNGGVVGAIEYELMTYAVATLTSANHYTLKATAGNKLRRAVFSAPTVGNGVSHAGGSRFAFLDPTGKGILKLKIDPLWIGKTLSWKFVPFNNTGGGVGTLSGATVYTSTPGGTSGNSGTNTLQYTQSPAVALSQPSDVSIAMAAVTESFPSNQVHYNARTFTIPDPAGTPTTYYVTIYDPGYLGDIGAALTRAAYCESNNSKVGKQGYVFIGSIIATHAAGVTATPISGGWPPSSSVPSIALAPGAAGNFTVAHGLGVKPRYVTFEKTSGGDFWFQSPIGYDDTNLYIVASDAGITGFARVFA